MKKIISFLTALVLVLSIIPMMASAKDYHKPSKGPSITEPHKKEDGKKKPDKKDHNKKDHHKKEKKNASVSYHDDANHFSSGYGYNAKYHWIQYACGCKFDMEPHMDPKDAEDDICTCGYQFSDNADLVTLWVDGCPPIKNFNKNITEYKLKAHTYKDVKEIKIATNTYDSEATVELPEDFTLKAGENKFDVKVIAENQKVTKTYTLIITK